jgi:hypothetical protein
MNKPKIPDYLLNKIPPSKRKEMEDRITENTLMAEKKAKAFLLKYDGVEVREFTELMSSPGRFSIQDIERKFLDSGVAVYVLYEEILGPMGAGTDA